MGYSHTYRKKQMYDLSAVINKVFLKKTKMCHFTVVIDILDFLKYRIIKTHFLYLQLFNSSFIFGRLK